MQNLWKLKSHLSRLSRYSVIPDYRKEKRGTQNLIKSFRLKATASTVTPNPTHPRWLLPGLFLYSHWSDCIFSLWYILSGFGEVLAGAGVASQCRWGWVCQRSVWCQIHLPLRSCCSGHCVGWETQDKPFYIPGNTQPNSVLSELYRNLLQLAKAVNLTGSVCRIKWTWQFILSPSLCFNDAIWSVGI